MRFRGDGWVGVWEVVLARFLKWQLSIRRAVSEAEVSWLRLDKAGVKTR